MSTVEESIFKSIERGGFPQKMVRLSFKAIYNSCKKHGVKLADVLEALKEREVFNEIGDEKILFYREKLAVESDRENYSAEGNPLGGSPDLMKMAMDQMKNMAPEQLKELKEKVSKMSPQELNEMLDGAKTMFDKSKNRD